jgi:hypothetical protein
MINRNLFTLLALVLLSSSSYSQEGIEEFKPYGKPFVKIYTNLHSTFTEGDSDKQFEITRAYFGYRYYLSNKISGALTLDVGDPRAGQLQMTAYLKTAYIQYSDGRVTAKIGMISLEQFKKQEDLWGGRYLYKSFMDEHNIGPSADLGAYVGYRIHDIVSVDLTIANGEGYKSLESDSIFKYSTGITISPVRNLDLRASYDYMGKDSPQQTMAFSAGYNSDKFRLGAEYNYQFNHNMEASHNMTGLSFYGSYQTKKTRIFGRYDMLSSNTIAGDTDPWNIGSDGQLIIAGLEFSPVKGLLITPNYQGWITAEEGVVMHSVYLNLEIKF